MKSLTILTVSYGHKTLLLENMRLAQSLHTNFKDLVDWHVAENSPIGHPDRFEDHEAGFIVTVGDGESVKGISHHHATALNKLLRSTQLNRHVLILDPDFFLLFADWATLIPKHMLSQNLGLFGAPWHPQHSESYRYFPAVHCFAFDTQVIDPASLDFTPVLEILTWRSRRIVKLINLIPIIGYRLIRRSWDTGTRVWLRYRQNCAVKYEVVTPIYCPNTSLLTFKNRLIEYMLPDKLCMVPKRSDYFSTETFKDRGWLNKQMPEEWETFVWKDLPFGLHVRRSYGSHYRNKNDEQEVLPKILEQIKKLVIDHDHLAHVLDSQRKLLANMHHL